MIQKKTSYRTKTVKDSIKADYNNHRRRGNEYFDDNRSGLVEKLINEEITEPDLLLIESKIHDALSMICVGDWKTACNELVNNVTVEGVYTQALHDEYVLAIQTYIADEY